MTSSYRRTVRVPQAHPSSPDPSTLGTAAEVPRDLACLKPSRARAFMYVVDDARTRRTVTLVFAITGAGTVLLCLLALLLVALGPLPAAVGGVGSAGAAVLAALIRRSRR